MLKRIMLWFPVILLLAVFLTGCSKSEVTYTDDTQTINVKAGDVFTIGLESNPTTGYGWQADFDKSLLSQQKEEYQAENKSGQKLVGSGGTQLLTFKALKPGQTKVTFTYGRSWEQPSAEDKQTVYTVDIK